MVWLPVDIITSKSLCVITVKTCLKTCLFCGILYCWFLSKKIFFNPLFFVKLEDIKPYKPPKYRWNWMRLSLFIYLYSKICIFTPIWWCCYCSPYSSFYTNLITKPPWRVLSLLLSFKRPSQIDCPRHVCCWLSPPFCNYLFSMSIHAHPYFQVDANYVCKCWSKLTKKNIGACWNVIIGSLRKPRHFLRPDYDAPEVRVVKK